MLRGSFNRLHGTVDDRRVGLSGLEGEGSDDLEHGHVVVVVKVQTILKGGGETGLTEGRVVPVVATLDKLIHGKDRTEPRSGRFALVEVAAVQRKRKAGSDDGTEENRHIGQDEEEGIAVGEGVLHFVDEAFEEGFLSVEERLVVLIGCPMGEAHAGEDDGAQTHERQDEQRRLDPRVGWMDVRCHVGLG